MRSWLSRVVAVDYARPDEARRAQTLNAMMAAAIPVALLAALVVFPYANGPISALFLAVACLVFVGLIWLTHRGRLTVATALFAVVLGFVTVAQPLVTGDLSTNPMLVPLCTVMLVYVFPLRQWYVVAGWVVTALVLLQVGTNDTETVVLPRSVWLLNAALATLLTVVVVTYAAHQFSASVRREATLAHQLTAREGVMQRLQELANTDPLTGFLNRRSLDDTFSATPITSAVALIDIDHFKSINDDHSHATGDATLVEFSGLIAVAAHDADLLFRLGGDEFLVVRPDVTASDLGAWLHELRREAQSRSWTGLAAGERVSFSAGVVNRAGADLRVSLHRADGALYAAKDQGRDAIVVVD